MQLIDAMKTTNQSAGKNWYLVYTKARQELVAAENLERQGFSVFLPRMNTRRRRQGRYYQSVEAMFPRYLFIQLDCINDNWHPIRSTIGVTQLIYFGNEPGRVPDDFVEMLMEQRDATGLQQVSEEQFAEGDRIRIIDGVMNGFEAVFQVRTSSERVKILLEYAGQYTELELSSHDIEKAS